MGNNGSRTAQIAPRQPIEPEQWANSFPRSPPRPNYQQHKVLPERDVTQKLRATNNGEILHSGGTLSGRHVQQTLSLERNDKSFKIFRSNSISSNPSDEYHHEDAVPTRPYVSRHKAQQRQRYENKNSQKEQMKKFGSEPDLRAPPADNPPTSAGKERAKGRKKYKAPSPPNSSTVDKSSSNYNPWEGDSTGGDEQVRRPRLFKTNAEAKKSSRLVSTDSNAQIEPRTDPPSMVCKEKYFPNVELRKDIKKTTNETNRHSLPDLKRSQSVPEFQAELKAATQRISRMRQMNDQNDAKTESARETKDKLKTLDHNIIIKENIRNKLKKAELEEAKERVRSQPVGKEATPEKSCQPTKEQPSKTFYFGMNKPISQPNSDNAIDSFAASLPSYNHTYPLPNSSGSDISSEMEMDESNVSSSGIALQLRPILPKKQLEIPRFSPAAAWKLLSAMESTFSPSTAASDDGPIFIEDRIEKLSRPPPPPAMQPGPRSSYDKSGDSGISGDAGPPGYDDSPEGVAEPRNIELSPVFNSRPKGGMSWTPQQDLGEDESSSDEETPNRNRIRRSTAPAKFVPRSNVFSLSLPRDNQLATILGQFGSSKRDLVQSQVNREQSENWFLSKSAPNSLNNGFNSLDLKSHHSYSKESDLGMANGSKNMTRIMYLPELERPYIKKQNSHTRQARSLNRDSYRERSRSADRVSQSYHGKMAKSCENISAQFQPPLEPANLQDPPKKDEEAVKVTKPKRFTFQSTIRQIERKRLAEKLSKEAEKKEKQRLSELRAMQRVEEEFQRKRAREKASIRQQLRLFSLDDTAWSSLPPNLDLKDEARPEPDGAVSSSASSPMLPMEKGRRYKAFESRATRKLTPSSESSEENVRKAPMTQVLSEYRQPQREYKDFRGNSRYKSEINDSHVQRQTTVHPKITCNMPKATDHQGGTGNVENNSNYRKQFAHGVKANKSGGSTYSEDSQPNNNYSPQIYRSKRMPTNR